VYYLPNKLFPKHFQKEDLATHNILNAWGQSKHEFYLLIYITFENDLANEIGQIRVRIGLHAEIAEEWEGEKFWQTLRVK